MRLFLLLSFFLATATLAVAAPADEPLETGLEEQVSVTASRTPIPLDETGNSITILTREDIEARGYPFLADLLRGLPGLSVSRSGPAGSQTQIRVRGAEANHILVRIDGVDVSDVFGADEVPFEMMTSQDIERIEFARGPQSGLWGSDAVAGVIDIVTRPVGERSDSARIETGSFGTTLAGGRLSAGTERLRFDAAVSYLDTDGTNVSRQGTEDDGNENTTATASLSWSPGESPFDLDVSARHTRATSEFDDIDFFTTGLPVDALNSTGTDLTIVQATGRWNSLDRRWSHRVSASSAEGDASTTLSGVPDTSTTIDKISVSAQSARQIRDGQHLTLAVDHERRDFRQRGTASFFGDPNQDRDIDNTGFAVEYRLRSADRWAASASVRHDRNSDFDNVTTFRVTGSFALGEMTRLRAATGTGQKAPTFIERFGFFSDTFVGNPNLRPEESFSFELGIDQRIGERASVAVTYFDATLEDEINGFFYDLLTGSFTAVNEAGKSDRRGLELAFQTPVGDQLAIHGSYTYTDTEQPSGETELRRPEHMASLAANWRSGGDRVKVRGSLNYTGPQEDLFFPPFPQPSQRVDLERYLLADVGVTVAVARRLEVTARIENLLDEEYEDVFGFRASGIGGYVGLRFHTARN